MIPVHRLDNAIDYTLDEKKCSRRGNEKSLEGEIGKALNQEKTEQDLFQSAIGCTCDTAFEDMCKIKKMWHKEKGVQGFHLVQSFAAGEVSPELALAHQIGLKFAGQLLGGEFQAVVSTHLNTKTLKSILISVGVRLSAFNLPQIARLTYTDDLHLEEMGEKKVALFCCIPDSDKSLNYLVGMIYGQLIQTLYFVADRKYKGRLPVPVHLLIDEAPNIALPTDNFLPWLSTMRSRNIFCSYIAQNMVQIKALFKEQWESLVGLCDEFLYLGGNEKETHKYVSELMGKETLDTNTYGHSRGRSGSFSINDQQTGRELLTPDEVRMLDNRKAILFVRGERPMLDDKYDLMRHPNIRLTEDGGAAPYDYTQAKDAADDLDYSPEQYDDFELLEPEDFLKP